MKTPRTGKEETEVFCRYHNCCQQCADRGLVCFLFFGRTRLALSALSAANPRDVLTSRATKIAEPQVFNIKIPFEGGPITNQRQTGRCWIFASTNVFRIALMQRYNLEAFELSQAYLFFWDKLEKSNWFLEQIISTVDEDLDSRLVQHLLREPLSDGGQVSRMKRTELRGPRLGC